MSRAQFFIFGTILCCVLSTSLGQYGRRNSHHWKIRSVTNYVPQQLTHTIDNTDLYKHRSPVCLIHQLAQKNNISIEYELIKEATTTPLPAANSTTPKPHSFQYRLHLGTETYRAYGSTKNKSKDKVSREAYDKTKYPKPTLKERTCVENATRTIVSILYEFAALNDTYILDKETQLEVMPPKYRIDLTLNQLSTSGEGFSKAIARREAAAKLVAILGKDYVLQEITKKFNTDEFMLMQPSERLDRILYARAEPLAIYSLNDEFSDMGRLTFLSRVETVTGDSIGTGRSLDESRDDAAKNLLKALGFKV